MNLRQEELDVDGLGKEVVGSGLQGLKAGLGLREPADHEHGQEGVRSEPLAEAAEKVVAGHAGHVDVEHYEVGRGAVEVPQGLDRVGEADHGVVSDALQRAGEHAHDARLVVDDEDVGVSVSEVTHVRQACPLSSEQDSRR